MSLNFYRTTRSHIPEDRILHTKYIFQEPILIKHFSWKWRRLTTYYCWQRHLQAELVYYLKQSRATLCRRIALNNNDGRRKKYVPLKRWYSRTGDWGLLSCDIVFCGRIPNFRRNILTPSLRLKIEGQCLSEPSVSAHNTTLCHSQMVSLNSDRRENLKIYIIQSTLYKNFSYKTHKISSNWKRKCNRKMPLTRYFITRPLNITVFQRFLNITWQRNFGLKNGLSSPAEQLWASQDRRN
jgi:hypothetical protein